MRTAHLLALAPIPSPHDTTTHLDLIRSYGEMLDAGRDICSAVAIPVLADGDTGYGNPMNVKRTVKGYAATGFAAVMIEDQVAPKRCGHTKGKDVVGRAEAIQVRAMANMHRSLTCFVTQYAPLPAREGGL